METPSSARRATRSQILAATNSNANNIPISRKSEKALEKSRPRTGNQQDRSALIDISNDSPIVGIAIGGNLVGTPLSNMSKNRNNNQAKDTTTKTPGSGEALLRGQVKTLLQKVEEETEVSKLSLEHKPFSLLKGCSLAPTPANTPLVLNLSDNEGFKNTCLDSVTPSPVQEQLMISQMVTEILEGAKQEGSPVSEKSLITRSLLLDFSEKSEGSDSSVCSSVLTNIGGASEGKEKDDDDASVWSVQVNASTKDDEEADSGIEENEQDDEEDEEQEEDGGLFDELCEWMGKISVSEGKSIPKFSGKHTRFVYSSDGEIEGEEECGVSPGIVRLKGLPTPEGKHFRFPEELEEEEDN